MIFKNQRFKVIISITLFILIFALLHIGCENKSTKVIPITELSLNHTTLELYVGDTDTLLVTIIPENATNKKVVWSSSDEEIVVVSQDGIVAAI